jgi:hypothetical protein
MSSQNNKRQRREAQGNDINIGIDYSTPATVRATRPQAPASLASAPTRFNLTHSNPARGSLNQALPLDQPLRGKSGEKLGAQPRNTSTPATYFSGTTSSNQTGSSSSSGPSRPSKLSSNQTSSSSSSGPYRPPTPSSNQTSSSSSNGPYRPPTSSSNKTGSSSGTPSRPLTSSSNKTGSSSSSNTPSGPSTSSSKRTSSSSSGSSKAQKSSANDTPSSTTDGSDYYGFGPAPYQLPDGMFFTPNPPGPVFQQGIPSSGDTSGTSSSSSNTLSDFTLWNYNNNYPRFGTPTSFHTSNWKTGPRPDFGFYQRPVSFNMYIYIYIYIYIYLYIYTYIN